MKKKKKKKKKKEPWETKTGNLRMITFEVQRYKISVLGIGKQKWAEQGYF